MRLFVALPIPRAAATELATRAGTALAAYPRARVYAAADLHLTLRFFGDLPRARIEDLRRTLAPLRAAALQLELTGVAAFRDAGVLFAAPTPSPALHALAEAVDEALAWQGFPRELHRFRPHVTLARLRHTLPQPELDRWSRSWPPLPLTLRTLAIYRSPDRNPTPIPPTDAARYTILHELPFTPGSPHVPESL